MRDKFSYLAELIIASGQLAKSLAGKELDRKSWLDENIRCSCGECDPIYFSTLKTLVIEIMVQGDTGRTPSRDTVEHWVKLVKILMDKDSGGNFNLLNPN